ncbi:hypothetical protein [Nonomuraea sp. NPDC049400]|uniref:hypothetical protein n=1 Tax=Nonomuraea sp. NPDC049400 TaxID=3364352 RepID=UPI00378EDE94
MTVPAVPGGSLADIRQNGPDDVLAVGTIAGPEDASSPTRDRDNPVVFRRR